MLLLDPGLFRLRQHDFTILLKALACSPPRLGCTEATLAGRLGGGGWSGTERGGADADGRDEGLGGYAG